MKEGYELQVCVFIIVSKQYTYGFYNGRERKTETTTIAGMNCWPRFDLSQVIAGCYIIACNVLIELGSENSLGSNRY